jgi:predicted DNA-binding transcriptional regulator YafY
MPVSVLDDLLLHHIPEAPASITAPALAEIARRQATAKAAPSLRTIQRSLDRLHDAHRSLQREEGKPHRWHFRPGTKRSALTRLDPSAALAFGLLEQHLDGLIPAPLRADLEPLFRKATEVAQALPQAHIQRWKQRATTASPAFPLRPPMVRQDILAETQKALLERSQLSVAYSRNGQEPSREHTLHPQGLILVDGVFYLVATVGRHTDLRQFALHRIERAHATGETSRDTPDFNASAYVNQAGGLLFKTGDMLKLRLRIRGILPLHLRERPLADDQTQRQLDEEWWELRATVAESEQLQWWLGSFGAQVEVLAPARLRRRMAQWAQETNELYSTRPRRKS